MASDQSPALPSTIELHFSPFPCPTANWGSLPIDFKQTANLAAAMLDTDATGYPGKRTIRDTCHAVYTAVGAGAPVNAVVLQALTNQIAVDQWSWFLLAFDEVYNGVIAPVLDGYTDEVVWTHRASDCSTRRMSAPWDSMPDQLNHDDFVSDCDARPVAYTQTINLVAGVLTLPKMFLYVEDNLLKWAPDNSDSVTICPP